MTEATPSEFFAGIFEDAKQNPEYYQEGLHIEIAERLYKEMIRQRLNYSSLGRKCNMHRAAVQRFFAGGNITIKTISRIAFALGKGIVVRPVLIDINKKVKK